jgi:diguanylate cyclase (GGDEF)-like protein
MAFSAAAMYAGAAFVALLEGVKPGGPAFSLLPGLVALVIVVLLLAVGPRLPFWALAAFGPIGAGVIALALATTEGPGDGAVLYMWPVLWVAHFLGRTGTVFIVVWVGVVHGVALVSLPSDSASLDRWLEVMVSVVVVAGVVHALSERSDELLVRLAAEARNDKLTGLLNRRGLDEQVRIELARAQREGSSIGLVSFDIDHFKRINDEQGGHDVGDRVLAHLGAVLGSEARGGDVVARMGGEEFLALLPRSDVEDARSFAERIRAAFAAPLDLDVPRATVSAGVTAAVAPVDFDALLELADDALYAAKRGGRDRTVVSDPLAIAAA